MKKKLLGPHDEGLAKLSITDLPKFLRGEPSTYSRVELPGAATVKEVRAARKAVALTQRQFAMAIGVSLETVKAWEAGKRKPEGTASKVLRLLIKRPRFVLELAGASVEHEAANVSFDAAVTQKRSWEKALARMGVEDRASFYRGAVEAAIVMSARALDPGWQKFFRGIQTELKRRFGAATVLLGAKDYEYAGRGARSVPATEVFKNRK